MRGPGALWKIAHDHKIAIFIPPAGLSNIIIDFLASVPVPDILLYRLVPRLICLAHYFPFQDEYTGSPVMCHAVTL